VQVVPEQRKHGDSDGDATDPQPAVHQRMVLCELQLVEQHVFDGVVERVLDGRPVPLVHLDRIGVVARRRTR
jgi:hypothetical protein